MFRQDFGGTAGGEINWFGLAAPEGPQLSSAWYTGSRRVALGGAGESPTRSRGSQVKDVDKCGLCGGDPIKKDNFKDAVLRLIPHVTARNIKRD